MKTIITLLLVCFATGCSSLRREPVRREGAGKPKAVLTALFGGPPVKEQSYPEVQGISRLEYLQSYFGGELCGTLEQFLRERERLEHRFRGRDLPCSAFEQYSGLSQLDPVTTGTSAPWDVHIREKSRTADAATYFISIQLQGSTHPYRRELLVVLRKLNVEWLVTEIRYADADLTFLGKDQTMRGLLVFMTEKLREAEEWGEKHPQALRPQGRRR